MARVNGMNHFSLVVQDVRSAIEFFTQVCGLKMQAFYWLHGVEGAYHIFFELNERCSAAIVFNPANKGDEPARRGPMGVGTTPGSFEHFAFNVDSEEALLAINARLRRHGYMTFVADHGFCRSVYCPNAIEQGILFEFSIFTAGFGQSGFFEQSAVEHAGFSPEDVERWRAPAALEEAGADQMRNPPWNRELQPSIGEEMASVLAVPEALARFEANLSETGDGIAAATNSSPPRRDT